MKIEIREYTPQDLEACRELWRSLTERHRAIYEDPTIGGDDPGPAFDEHLAHPGLHKVWLAESGGRIVGLCGLLRQGDEAELEPIVVHEDVRSQGIGAALVKHAHAEAMALGAHYFNVRPVGRNLEAIAFFRRSGFDVLGRLELSMALTPSATQWSDEVDVHGQRFKF